MGLSARELGLKAVKTRKTWPFFFEPTISEFDAPPNPFLPLSSAPETPPSTVEQWPMAGCLVSLMLGLEWAIAEAHPMHEWHFRALGALASHSPRHGRPRLERPLLDAIGADPRASKPAELSTAAPKPGALIAPPPAQARPAFGSGHPRGAQPVPPQLALHGPLLVAICPDSRDPSPSELHAAVPKRAALRSPCPRVAETSRAHLSVPAPLSCCTAHDAVA